MMKIIKNIQITRLKTDIIIFFKQNNVFEYNPTKF